MRKFSIPLSVYPIIGVVLALGAPAGWSVIERMFNFTCPAPYRTLLYIYMTLGTALAFGCFAGFVVSRLERESRLTYELQISKAEIERQKEKTRADMEALREKMLKISQLGARVTKATEEDELYYRLAYAVQVALDFDRVLIFKNTRKGLVITEARGVKADSKEELRKLEELVIPCSMDAGAIGIACSEARSLIFGTNDYIPPKYRLKPPYSEIEAIRSRSFIVVPVKIEGEDKARAVIAADRKYRRLDVNHYDLVALEILADMAATTLARLEMERELEVLARVDGLTGLLNRHTWMKEAEKEFERAKRYKVPFAVVMLDVDDFKSVNDNWGHLAGDIVLRKIGKILREECRSVDVPGRYGGEEFVVLLPHTDMEGAVSFAERIRKRIEQEDMKIPRTVTATFGVAVFDPENPVDSLDQLLIKADKALYKGKDMGKNVVVRAE